MSKTVHQEIRAAAETLAIPYEQAARAYKTPGKTVKVTEKVTVTNFYKNPTFWKAAGIAIVSASTGEWGNVIGAALSIFGGN